MLHPLLTVVVLSGLLATALGTGEKRYGYRETVSPWSRGIISFDPDASLMAEAPFLFQAHAVSAWLLFAVWPFTRLVHAWSVPLSYLVQAPIVSRARRSSARRHRERERLRAEARERPRPRAGG